MSDLTREPFIEHTVSSVLAWESMDVPEEKDIEMCEGIYQEVGKVNNFASMRFNHDADPFKCEVFIYKGLWIRKVSGTSTISEPYHFYHQYYCFGYFKND